MAEAENSPPTAADVAQFMLDEFNTNGKLIQAKAARLIKDTFGLNYVYKNKNHNWAIRKDILAEFRKLTDNDTVVWSRSGQLWRTRREKDPAGTRMVR